MEDTNSPARQLPQLPPLRTFKVLVYEPIADTHVTREVKAHSFELNERTDTLVFQEFTHDLFTKSGVLARVVWATTRWETFEEIFDRPEVVLPPITPSGLHLVQ